MNEVHIQQVIDALTTLGLRVVHFPSRGLVWIEVCRLAKNDKITMQEFDEGEARFVAKPVRQPANDDYDVWPFSEESTENDEAEW